MASNWILKVINRCNRRHGTGSEYWTRMANLETALDQHREIGYFPGTSFMDNFKGYQPFLPEYNGSRILGWQKADLELPRFREMHRLSQDPANKINQKAYYDCKFDNDIASQMIEGYTFSRQ